MFDTFTKNAHGITQRPTLKAEIVKKNHKNKKSLKMRFSQK